MARIVPSLQLARTEDYCYTLHLHLHLHFHGWIENFSAYTIILCRLASRASSLGWLVGNDVHKSLRYSKIITYADESVIFASSKDLDTIQHNLSEDINSLASWLRDNELIINIKKGKTVVMLFGTDQTDQAVSVAKN